VFAKHNLRAEEADLEIREMVSFTFEDGDAASVIQNLISETAFLVGNKLAGDAVHGKRHGEIKEGLNTKSDWHVLMLLEQPESMMSLK
jgi:hypothetical protein